MTLPASKGQSLNEKIIQFCCSFRFQYVFELYVSIYMLCLGVFLSEQLELFETWIILQIFQHNKNCEKRISAPRKSPANYRIIGHDFKSGFSLKKP